MATGRFSAKESPQHAGMRPAGLATPPVESPTGVRSLRSAVERP